MDPHDTAKRTGKAMIFVMWLLVIAGFTWFFNQWIEKRNNPNQHIDAHLNEYGQREVVLQRNYSGHFVTTGTINEQSVVFLLDTGATDISIPEHIAKQLGLKKGRAFTASTANGLITVFETEVASVGIDELRLKHIRASINPYMQSDDVLLGMSFLQHLDIEQKGETLTLSIPQ